jgi:hypothetical protein
MSEVERRFSLTIDGQVAADLGLVKAKSRLDYFDIMAFIEQLEGDFICCESLIDEHYDEEPIESVEPFWHLQNQRFNVYRVKLVNIRNWRILTAGDHKNRRIAILAIMDRSQNYQDDSEFVQRLKESYDKLEFSQLGR